MANDYEIDPVDHLPARRVKPWTQRKHHYLSRYMDAFATTYNYLATAYECKKTYPDNL